MSSPSATLAVWGSSWLNGHSAPDDVIDALHQWAPLHFITVGERVTHAPAMDSWAEESDGSAMHLLRLLRHVCGTTSAISVVLPAPGDARGLPPGTAFSAAAFSEGEAVILHSDTESMGLVPSAEGDEGLSWCIFPLEQAAPLVQPHPLGEAEYLLRTATRDAAAALGTLEFTDLAGPGDVRPLIVEALADLSTFRYPDSIPPRAARVFDSANEIDAILRVADDHSPLGSLTATGATAREDVLRPLRTAVREARLAAIYACADAGRRRGI
ncbi:hypothetical protein IEU95_06755 [Hoyosella rhizosphaerae]|uniref:Uncharacterized protein n=1 Tax=Hoyosella rhizosphaerae TaxID=1755582 RepID=A0A916XA26_9ACTN|nr:hypothetical protein [Hoyosella rhizosphaerae]MBN4926522.1 hypothetical protein [Hoyosella rhizosphaerae]GGC58609.1 hypothetical protein GCM10011410_08890 [Hoyosella rhizosphaerae]